MYVCVCMRASSSVSTEICKRNYGRIKFDQLFHFVQFAFRFGISVYDHPVWLTSECSEIKPIRKVMVGKLP